MHRMPFGSLSGSGSLRWWLPALAVALVGVACAARAPELEPRYVAVHDAFAAMGMAEVPGLADVGSAAG